MDFSEYALGGLEGNQLQRVVQSDRLNIWCDVVPDSQLGIIRTDD